MTHQTYIFTVFGHIQRRWECKLSHFLKNNSTISRQYKD